MAERRVALLHGLGRSALSLLVMEKALQRKGMVVCAFDYASTRAGIGTHAEALAPQLLDFAGEGRVSFVTHSMGGIVWRWMTHREHGHPVLRERVDRTVMLAPPNGGSELVDRLSAFVPMEWVNGPAGAELGTKGTPSSLGPVDLPVGVIAGRRSLNPLTSSILPDDNDGKVSVAATHVDGEADHIVLPASHTFMMNAPVVIAQTLAFLETGRFEHGLTSPDALRRVISPS